MGAWDLIEECVPDYWWVKLFMIILGGGVLTYQGRLSASEPAIQVTISYVVFLDFKTQAAAPSQVENKLNTCCRIEAAANVPVLPPDGIATRVSIDMAACSAAAPVQPLEAEAAVPKASASLGELPNLASKMETPKAKLLLLAKRYHFNPPKLNAGKCTQALVTIAAGLIMWVGIWDLVDYHIIPVVTRYLVAGNMSALGVCEHPSNEAWVAGLEEIYARPFCIVTKALLLVFGILGLYVTHTLYGTQDDLTYKRLP